MDTRFLDLAAQCLEVSLASAMRESPKAKGEQLSTKGKKDDEREGEGRSLLWSIIACLSMERDHSKGQPEEPVKIVPNLSQQASMDAARSKLPHGMACGIKRLESEVARLRSEIARLEAILPDNQNDGKEDETKDAKEKVKDTKQVADEEENEAKEAMAAKQPHLPFQRNMNKENDETLPTIPKQKKLKNSIRAKLKLKQCGAPHVRDAAADANNTVALTSDGFEDRRADVYLIMAELDKFRGFC